MAEYTEHFFDAPDMQSTEGATHEIHYLKWGDASKPALFCVHGLTRNARDFDYLARALSTQYHVICPSMAGRGKSAYLSDTNGYNYLSYMSDCIALAEHLGVSQCDWIGTSMGGLIGMMTAALNPRLIRKLVINDIGFIVPKEALTHICNYAANPPRFASFEDGAAYLHEIQSGFGIAEAAHWAHFAEHSLIQDKVGWRLCYDQNILEPVRAETNNFAQLQDIDLSELWEPVACPVLLLRGAHSEVLPIETAAMMRQDKPQLTFIEIPDCGHAPHLMSAEQIGLIQEWLESN